MKNVIITKETTVKEALAGNKVLMVGRIPSKNEIARQSATSGKVLAMYGKLPNKRDMEMTTTTVVNDSCVVEVEDRVEIPSFLLKAQEERRIERAMQQQFSRNKKKAPSTKPSLKNIIVNTLKSL